MAYRHRNATACKRGVQVGRIVAGAGLVFTLLGANVASAADIAPRIAPVVPPIKTYSTVLFGGFDDRTHSYYGYVGGIHALNGNIAADGFLVRGFVLYNPYDYQSTAVAGGVVDGKMTAFNAMVGFQKNIQNLVARFYFGVDYENHRLSPDNPFDRNDGTHWGAHLRGELETQYLSPVYGSLLADYGSGTDRWWLRGRAGYNFSGFIIGPEGVVTGNWVTHEQRVGAFVTIRSPKLVPFELSISGGYSHTDPTRGGGSAYGTLELSLAL